MVHVGIDLGTSNTVVATINSDGQPVVRSIDEQSLIPSVIYVERKAGRRTFGQDAIEEWADPQFDANSAFRRWKLDMGSDRVLRRMQFGAPGATRITDITPEQLTTWFVEDVVGKLARGVGGDEIESILVTVPHGWRRETPEKCAATRRAASLATINSRPVKVQAVTLSEPVAAAVYWLWAARQRPEHQADEFIGKTVLVVDIGGGTFDLSLVRIGTSDAPLIVIDAANSDVAGDYVTALIMTKVDEAIRATDPESIPRSAETLLKDAVENDDAQLRGWFLQAEEMQRKLSRGIAQAAKRGRTTAIAVRGVFEGADGGEIPVAVVPAEFITLLEPFYAAGRRLVGDFLARQSQVDRPYGVVFAGGGSRIAGVADQIVRPELEALLVKAEDVLTRITLNEERVDQAVALGAALVANGIVSVQERLLYDIGLQIAVAESLAKALGLPRQARAIVLSPLLARGDELPTRFASKDFNLPPMGLLPGESLDLTVVIQDDPRRPWIQTWEVAHPAGGSSVGADVVLEADTDGVLSVEVVPVTGNSVAVLGALTRVQTGRATLVIGDDGNEHNGLPPIATPEQLRAALTKARTGS